MLPWNQLLANLALVALTVSLWTASQRRLDTLSQIRQQLIFGLLMAGATLLVMLIQFQFTTGVLLDLRYTLIAVSGYFGGPVAVVFPVVVALVKRLYTGGTGVWVAVPHITLAAASGLYGFYQVSRKENLSSLLLFSAAVVFSGTIGFFVMVPAEAWPSMIQNVVAPFAAILFVSTFFSSFALVEEVKRQRLLQENQIYRAVFEALPDCLNAKDQDGRFIAANAATAALMGAKDATELLGKSDDDYFPENVAISFRYDEKRQRLSGEPLTIEQRFLRPDGQEAWLSTLKAPLTDAGGNTVGVITHNREITEQKRLELRLAETRRHLSDAIASMTDGLAMFDASDVLVFCNSRYQSMFPLTADVRLPGTSMREIMQASVQRGEVRLVDGSPPSDIDASLIQLKGRDAVRQIRLVDGRWIEARSHLTNQNGLMVVFSDVTVSRDAEDELKRVNTKLAQLANTDQLTSLPNRRAFDINLDAAIFEAVDSDTDATVLMIDIDHFKLYNDTYGHIAGDEALQKVAGCIESHLSGFPGATVSRYGGEEFAVVLPLLSVQEGASIGQLLCGAVRGLGVAHKLCPGGYITISVGAASLRSSTTAHKADLLLAADTALYQAKARGRDQVRVVAEAGPSVKNAG